MILEEISLSAQFVSENVRKLFKIPTLKLTRDLGEKRKMRSDYGLYGVAIICFLLAAVFAAGMVSGYELSEAPGITVTVVFLLIGVIATAVGYSARPKAMMPPKPIPTPTPATPAAEATPTVEEPIQPVTPPPPPPPTPVEEVSVAPEPSPPQPSEPSPPTLAASTEETQPAPAEGVTEEKPKRTRRRRKKAAA